VRFAVQVADLDLLAVDVQRRLYVRMSHQLLLYLDGRVRALEPRPVAVTEGVPTDRTEPSPFSGRFDLPIEDAILPHWFAGVEVGEDEVVRSFVRIRPLLLPTNDFGGKSRIKGKRHCLACGARFELPYTSRALSFACSSCSHVHYLSDYLGISEISDDFGREITVSNLRNILETLILFDLVRKFGTQKEQMRKTLFIKDGPLLLRAQLSRLVEPIRSLLAHLRDVGIELHVVGVEKNGGFVSLIDEFQTALPSPGDYFLPSVRFLVEEVAGGEMPDNYRNRVSYGAKVAARLGPNHVVVLHVPTGEFSLDPKPQDLLGFDQSVRVLSKLVSYRYENALVPLVLINSMVSIAQKPSGTILETFAAHLMGASS